MYVYHSELISNRRLPIKTVDSSNLYYVNGQNQNIQQRESIDTRTHSYVSKHPYTSIYLGLAQLYLACTANDSWSDNRLLRISPSL